MHTFIMHWLSAQSMDRTVVVNASTETEAFDFVRPEVKPDSVNSFPGNADASGVLFDSRRDSEIDEMRQRQMLAASARDRAMAALRKAGKIK